MEAMLKKYQQKFRKVREEMEKWNQLQSRLVSQFRNFSSVIERLPESKHYGTLSNVDGLELSVLGKQVESMHNISISMNETLEEFHSIVLTIEKMYRDGVHLVKNGSTKVTEEQLQQRVGSKPSLAYCLEGLECLHDMHSSEYRLKTSIISAIPKLILNPNRSDLVALQQLLVDQPNIPEEEVQEIFDIIFAGEN